MVWGCVTVYINARDNEFHILTFNTVEMLAIFVYWGMFAKALF